MKKSFFSLMLAIAAGMWTLSNAMCLGSIPDAMYEPYTTVSGTIQALPLPCEPGEECPPCLTEAIVTNDKTYYLTTKNQQVADFLEQIQTSPVPAIYLLPLKATASGTPYQIGSFDYLLISSLNELSVEYFSNQQENKLPSLCDEWNIFEVSNVTCGGCEEYRTYHSQLTKDTIINGKVYAQLIEDGAYRAALREGDKRDIYCIPAGSTHEYLLYDFDVQAGDQLENLWLGGMPEDYPNGWTMTVEEIQEGTPRTYVLSTGYTQPEEGLEVYPLYCTWIEGVGLSDGPVGVKRCVGCADSRGYGVLCAYKNGAHIFTSDLGEQYGCEYNYNPYETPTDTIPLFSYTGDDPGSSTVDPVDPNQVVVTLNGNELTIREHTGVDITYSLQHNAPAKMPVRAHTSASDTFRNEITLQITESGEYQLLLTNPSWDYSIYGTFFYSPQGIESVHSTSVPQKVLQNGQFYILRNGKVYTITGQKLK